MNTLRLAMIGLALAASSARAQSRESPEMFNEQDVVHGISISRPDCARLEAQETAVWVVVAGKGYCLRYYAYGLKPGREGNTLVAGWLHGDVVGGSHPKHAGHQQGLGVNAMIAQERALSDRYKVPFVFLARPGAYGSAGYHPTMASTRLEADLVSAQVAAISARYGIRSWVLGGHSGGGTLVAELIVRRKDIRCAVISSGAPAHSAYLEAWGAAREIKAFNLNPIDDVQAIKPGEVRVIVMGDPRDKNVLWPVQQLYQHALVARGIDATLIPLERGLPDEFHSLVDLGEAATGLCANGASFPEIKARLDAMPSQGPRISN
jgi:pimeloyl-ACP methyl ester carboxylesterase